MGTTLDHGIYLPDEGERNCYEGLAGNWVALDNHLGSTNIHVTINDKQAWDGHVADTTIHVTSADKQAWDGHIADTTIHVTSADKQAWDGHVADSVKHVTAEDKAKWDAVTSKADDSAVVHKSGGETIAGQKLFNDINAISSSAEIGVSGGYNSFKVLDKNKKTISRLDGGTFSTGMAYSQWLVNNGTDVFNGVSLYQPSTNLVQLRPYSSTLNVQLGASNRYFSDFYTSKVNGVEPSSLSLPDFAKRIDISSYITNLSGTYNAYTPSVDGWIAIQSSDATFIRIADTGSGGLGNTVTSQTAGILTCMIPVRVNRQNNIYIVCSTLTSAYFIPCQGKV